MIVKGTQLDGSSLKSKVCVIGGGPVAIACAHSLSKKGIQVILIPGGGWKESQQEQDLYKGSVEPENSHEPLEENRRRVWGGTSTAWGGRCVPFDSIDFQERTWIPDSGWPISQAQAEQYLPEALSLCNAGPASFNSSNLFPNTSKGILPGFDNLSWDSTNLERWSPPTDFAKAFKDYFLRNPRVSVLLEMHLLKLRFDHTSKRITQAVVSSFLKKNVYVQAEFFVLATGGLENARILLSNNESIKKGIGNSRDLVGRYYQSHLVGIKGFVKLHSFKNFNYDFEKDGPVYCRRRFWLTESAQQKHKTCNIIGFFLRDLYGTGLHHDAVSSITCLAKIILGRSKNPYQENLSYKKTMDYFLYHLAVIFKDGPQSAPYFLKQLFFRSVSKRRLPYFLPPMKSNKFPLFYQSEQAPNFESRVILDEYNLDAFGIPRLKVKIRFSEVDYYTVDLFHALFEKRISDLKIGTFTRINQPVFLFNSNAHHIGTTRMAANDSSGVVDMNCRVFGTHNLFLAGSSVFPTGSHANPTLLALSLSLRLASHISNL